MTTVPLHLGALHPFEQALVLLVAFGPFVVLGIVVRRSRRRAITAEREDSAGEPGVAHVPLPGQRLVQDPVDE
jgi:hypothetical protein